jgi:uncharacterized spore protein YtfJ
MEIPKNANGASVTDTIKGTRDALSVKRVFGDVYELDGIQVIPVARVAGGAGGGGGEGESADDDSSGSGFGSGFGMHVRALGVYEVRDGHAVWKPAVDVNRVIRGGQVLAGIAALCVTVVALIRR